MTNDAPPESVSLTAGALTLHWSDGTSSVSASTLRANCRCAPCQSARLRGDAAATDALVTLSDATPIGHYAVQLRFGDGHDRGIFPWGYLRQLAR